ncbi:LuxR family transcriptional regulator [Kribbella sp. VKM Ac-2568]|uniref:helix-turn-helix transcriptional regulator n=1 Tax=Kribbella sp. VKM Ac-2568 TaxID=2512219 RepID=UPI00104A3A50|nr:LuxR family transcriptional regulator [Kribbella sp. VKM Ac-2568]TCM37032.1 regulatory LuxR family protein [Kribbella sp. VKM Ac-2568]
MDEVSAAAYGLFGREDAVRLVSDVLDHGGSAVAIGEPGVGKSSLLKVADQLAQRRGRRVLSVTPTQFDRGLPFAGLAELVNQCPEGAADRLPGPQRRALAVALQRAEPDGEIDALAVPLAVRSLLTQLCEVEPVTLFIDDLQWLDQASVGSLGFALRAIDSRRLSVLIASRPDPDAGADLLRSLAEPRQELVLRPLEDWAIGQLLRKRLGQRWTPPVAAGVARASSGNPFLALMIAQAMQSDVSKWRWSAQQGHDPIFPVPPSLTGLLGEKVALLLSQTSRDVLLLVSAAGRLTVTQLQRMVEEARLRSALEAADDADIARVGAGSVVTFTHPLLASALYDAAAPGERRRAHRVLADKLEDAVERARHRSRSITTPDEMVAEELERAADISRSRGAQQLAGELLEGAALATPSDLDTSDGFRRWLRAVDTYIDAGDTLSAGAALDKGSTLAGTPEQRARGLARRAKLADDLRGSRTLAEQAFRIAPPGAVRAEILQTLSEQHRMQGNGRLALRLTRMAITEAGAAGREDIQLVALYQRQSIEWIWGLGDPKQTLHDMERLVESSSLELTPAEWAGARAFYAAWNDDTAESIVREAISRAIDAGRYGDLSSLYIWLILALIRASRVREAQAALDDADRSGGWVSAFGLQEDMARILIKEYSGDLDAARELAERAAARSRSSGLRYWLGGFLAQLGFIETSARNWHAALEPLREMAEIFTSTKMVDLEQLLWPVDLADAALQVGALRDVETAISLLRRQGAAGRPEATAAADRCRALLTAARGDVDNALPVLRQLVDRTGAECPFEAARTRLALGQVYRRAGQKALANETLIAAAEAFDELGIPRWAERARDEADRVGLHPTTALLTATERRVAELVGSGRSNQEAAAELFMSVKTVEANLTRIYRKLSVRSRTELANHLNKPDQ